jgi:adenylate kinase
VKIILLGAPGAGKGSQAEKLKEALSIPHISTGDAFRTNIKNGTEIGVYAKSFIDKGLLVPDEVTIKIVESRLKEADCKNGFLLDGFPRSIPQAEALGKITKIDYVLNVQVDLEVVLKRLTGRRTCSACGGIYHTSTHNGENCDKCGANLIVRDDDKEEAILKRLEVYNKTTQPLIDYYSQKGCLVDVNGNASVEDTFQEILSILK